MLSGIERIARIGLVAIGQEDIRQARRDTCRRRRRRRLGLDAVLPRFSGNSSLCPAKDKFAANTVDRLALARRIAADIGPRSRRRLAGTAHLFLVGAVMRLVPGRPLGD